MFESLPLLDSVEALEGWDGDKDDNCLPAVANFDLIKTQKSAGELQDTLYICVPWTASRPIPLILLYIFLCHLYRTCHGRLRQL